MMSEAGNDVKVGSQQHPDDPAQYWGYLFQRNKSPTDKLDRLLKGIAICISNKYDTNDYRDLTPTQLASFYRDAGGNYDSLFLDQSPQSIAFIYKSLGCLHSIQPDLDGGRGYSPPSIPALKPRGFVTWQTIQILLGPQEHVPFIQNALRAYDVTDPVTNVPFPKILPESCFPSYPDPAMEKWHDSVSNRLRIDAEGAVDTLDRLHIEGARHHSRPSSSVDGAAASADERSGSFRYVSDPHHHRHEERPKIVRAISSAAPQSIKDGGKAMALTMKNIASPHLWSGGNHGSGSDHRSGSHTRRRSRDTRGDDVSENDQTNIPLHPSHVPSRHVVHHGSTTPTKRRSPRPSPRNSTQKSRASRHSRRSRSLSSGPSDTSSWEDEKSTSPHRRKPRRHRSHDPPMSEYFGRQDWNRDPPSSQYLSDMGHGASRQRRKSDDHGRAHGRERAHNSVSEGTQGHKVKLPPEDQPARGPHQHRASMPHYRPAQGYGQAGGAYETYPSRTTPPGSRHQQPPAAFKDPWAADDYAKRGFDHKAFRAATPSQYGTSMSAPASGAAMSPPGSSSPDSATASASGMRPSSHRYVTPVNGVKGRQYPKDTGWR